MSIRMLQSPLRSLAGVPKRSASRAAGPRALSVSSMGVSSPPRKDEALLRGLYRWIERCNTGSVDGFIPFTISNSSAGFVDPTVAKMLASRVQVNSDPAFELSDQELRLSEKLRTSSLQERAEAISHVLRDMNDKGVIDGWRDELYPVASRYGEDPELLVERCAAPLLGIKGYGVHMNGYVRKQDGIYLWVATRSANKPTWPSKLDHIAAGGQPHGLGVVDNMEKEAAEEAGIPAHLASKAAAVGAVSYTSSYTYKSGTKGLKQDVLFVFDLELPEDFVPQVVDGEVEKFELMEVGEVMDIVSKTDRYKDNCNLVLIDFFMRHGLLDPGAPGYLDLLAGVRLGKLT